MGNFDDYRPDAGNSKYLGAKMVEILDAKEGVSKAGNPMITIKVKINCTDKTIKHYIVKNDWFNSNMTRVFDCFGIERGNFSFLSWIGCIGGVNIVEDDYGFLKIGKFFTPSAAQAANLAWVGEMPEKMTVSELDMTPVDESDLPF